MKTIFFLLMIIANNLYAQQTKPVELNRKGIFKITADAFLVKPNEDSVAAKTSVFPDISVSYYLNKRLQFALNLISVNFKPHFNLDEYTAPFISKGFATITDTRKKFTKTAIALGLVYSIPASSRSFIDLSLLSGISFNKTPDFLVTQNFNGTVSEIAKYAGPITLTKDYFIKPGIGFTYNITQHVGLNVGVKYQAGFKKEDFTYTYKDLANVNYSLPDKEVQYQINSAPTITTKTTGIPGFMSYGAGVSITFGKTKMLSASPQADVVIPVQTSRRSSLNGDTIIYRDTDSDGHSRLSRKLSVAFPKYDSTVYETTNPLSRSKNGTIKTKTPGPADMDMDGRMKAQDSSSGIKPMERIILGGYSDGSFRIARAPAADYDGDGKADRISPDSLFKIVEYAINTKGTGQSSGRASSGANLPNPSSILKGGWDSKFEMHPESGAPEPAYIYLPEKKIKNVIPYFVVYQLSAGSELSLKGKYLNIDKNMELSRQIAQAAGGETILLVGGTYKFSENNAVSIPIIITVTPANPLYIAINNKGSGGTIKNDPCDHCHSCCKYSANMKFIGCCSD